MPTMEDSYSHLDAMQGGPAASAMRCAGCSASDVPLLACDDMDENGTANPSQRARYVDL